jgi:hypothetical protein
VTTIVLDAKIPDSALAAETTELVRDWILNAVLADRTERRPPSVAGDEHTRLRFVFSLGHRGVVEKNGRRLTSPQVNTC